MSSEVVIADEVAVLNWPVVGLGFGHSGRKNISGQYKKRASDRENNSPSSEQMTKLLFSLQKLDFATHRVDKQQTTLIPGQYVPVQLIAGHQPDALLTPQAALVQSQIGARVFVVDKDNKVETRRVKVVRAYDKQWVIRDGLKKAERVIVNGLQKVRSGMVVRVSEAGSGGEKG